jgi:hypothetical protein
MLILHTFLLLCQCPFNQGSSSCKNAGTELHVQLITTILRFFLGSVEKQIIKRPIRIRFLQGYISNLAQSITNISAGPKSRLYYNFNATFSQALHEALSA